MAASRLAGKLNDACKLALDGVTGVTAYQGRLRMTDATDFESTIRALEIQEECIAVTWVSLLEKKTLATGTCELSVLLFFRLLKDASSDCNKMYDLVDVVVTTLAGEDPWKDLGCTIDRVTALRSEDGLQDDVVEYKVTVELAIPPAC